MPGTGRAAEVLADVAETNRAARDQDGEFMDSGERREDVPVDLWRACR